MAEHRYAGPRVNDDRSVTHSCVCGFQTGERPFLAEHFLEVIDREAVLKELQRRNPTEKWIER